MWPRNYPPASSHLGDILQDRLHILLKANVEHLVSLIQHDKPHLRAMEAQGGVGMLAKDGRVAKTGQGGVCWVVGQAAGRSRPGHVQQDRSHQHPPAHPAPTWDRSSASWSIRSMMRPGVPTTISTPRRSSLSWGPMGLPP